MNVVQILFSPTGGTKKAADILAADWGGAAKIIDLTDPREDFSRFSLSPDDLALIALPSYEGRVPSPAAARLAQVKGNGAPCVLLCVFGNRAFDDTLAETQDLAQAAGFQPAAALAAAAQHSILGQYGAGRPDNQDARQLREFAGRIAEKLESGRLSPLSLPGGRPYRQTKGLPMRPKTGENCSHCGLCARQCPVQAISAQMQTDRETCIVCMRCVAQCPARARQIGAFWFSAANLLMKKKLSGRKENQLFL